MLWNNQVIDSDNNMKSKEVSKNKYTNISERQLKHLESTHTFAKVSICTARIQDYITW